MLGFVMMNTLVFLMGDLSNISSVMTAAADKRGDDTQ